MNGREDIDNRSRPRRVLEIGLRLIRSRNTFLWNVYPEKSSGLAWHEDKYNKGISQSSVE
jgi:hypothetical protein